MDGNVVKTLQTPELLDCLDKMSKLPMRVENEIARWNDEYRMRHDRLFEAADIVTATGHEYTKACMFRCNRYLVQNADLMLAAFDGKPGGTAMTCVYAREMGVCCFINRQGYGRWDLPGEGR